MPDYDDKVTLRDVLATVGGGTAIGLGTRKWYQNTNFRDVVAQNRIPGFEKAFSATQRALQNFKTGDISRATRYNEVGLSSLISAVEEGTVSLSPEDVKSVLLRAAEHSDPSGTVTARIATGMGEGLTTSQLLQDVMSQTRETSSIYYQRTISSFLADVNAMEGMVQRGESLIPSQLGETKLFRTIPLQPGRLSKRGELSDILRRIEEQLKAKMTLRGRVRTTEGAYLKGKELLVNLFDSPFLGPQREISGRKIPQLTLTLPLSLMEDSSMVVKGATGQSSYIAGEFWELEKMVSGQFALRRKMRYEEWAARRFLEENVHRIIEAQRMNRREVYAIQQEFHRGISEVLDWTENITPGLHPAHDRYVEMRKQVARLSGISGRRLTDIEYATAIERGIVGLGGETIDVFPSASPSQMARSVVSLQDWRGMNLFGEAFDWGRRPLQAFREEYTPTYHALRRMRENALMNEYSWAMRGGRAPAPLVRTLFVSPERAAELASVGMNVEGSGLISTAKLPMFAQEELVRYKVSSRDLHGLAGVLGNLDQTRWDLNQAVIKKGTVLGRGPTGELITVPETFKALEAVRYQDKNLQDFVKVVGTRTHENMEWFKVFGDTKAMMRSIPQRQLSASVSYVFGGGDLGYDLGYNLPVHALVTADELRKTRSLHYKQIFTSLHEFTKENFNKGLVSTSNFYNDPAKVIAAIERNATQLGRFQHEYVLSEAYQLARTARLTPAQMGGVFGAVPDVFGLKNLGEEWLHLTTTGELLRRSIRKGAPISQEEAARQARALLAGPEREKWARGYGISSEEITRIGMKAPVGLAQFHFGGRWGPGSGKLGTIEPRLYELLSSPHLGELGPMLQEEISTRMFGRYGFRAEEQRALAASISSMIGLRGRAGALPSAWTQAMSQAGGLLNIPGMGDVSIPSTQAISQLASYKTAAGMEVRPQLGVAYEQLIEDARKLQTGAISQQEMRKSIEAVREEAQRAYSGTVTGKGGLLRGRLEGSRFLTAVPIQPGIELARNEIGITAEYARMMLTDIERIHGKGAAEEVASKLFSGASVGAAVMRHPVIGPYSTAAVAAKIIPGEGPMAMFGEQFMEATLMGPTPQRIGGIRISPAIGMAMDYDADVVNMMLLSGATERKAYVASISADYDAYAIRSQLLKAKKGVSAGAITIHEAAAGAALRMRVPKERLGLISESLQTARAAMLASKVESGRVMNALGFLEWLEQAPISSKHVPAGQEKSMLSLFANIRQSVINRDQEKLAQSALSIVGKGTLGEQFMRGGGRVRLTGPSGTRLVNVPGVDVERAASDITAAIGEFNFKGIEGVSPSRIRQLIRGRGAAASAKESELLVRHGIRGVSPFGAFFQTVDAPGATAAATRELGSMRNRIAATGGRLLEHAKPIAIGFAAAIGIGMLLSRPPKMMSQQGLEAPRPRLKKQPASERMSPESVPNIAGDAVVGSPTVDNAMEGVNTARIMPTASHFTVRAQSPRGIDYDMFNSQLSHAAGGARVNSRVIDNRRSLSPQSLSRIMREE